jgi:peptidoglycan-N-acetylglucosamine deacetylase
MIRYVLAPVLPGAARAIGVQRTLAEAAGVLLTFDDGPHPQGTPAVLDALSRAGARAMFFLVGEQVQRRPALAARIASEGHVVALHGYRHTLQLRRSGAAVDDDLDRGRAVIEDAVGFSPAYHRPPYGIYSPAGLAAARAAHLQPLLWSRWGKDWRKFTTPTRIADRILRGISGGDVILLHDADFYSARGSHERTVVALAVVLDALRKREIATVLPV